MIEIGDDIRQALLEGTNRLLNAAERHGDVDAGRQVNSNLRALFPKSADPAGDFVSCFRPIDPGFCDSDSPEQRRAKLEHAQLQWENEVGR